jgi:hypothetical protein
MLLFAADFIRQYEKMNSDSADIFALRLDNGVAEAIRLPQSVQIQLISGHSSKKSLQTYQHLGLVAVEAWYQEAVRSVVI